MTKKVSQTSEITTTISSRYLSTSREATENDDAAELGLVETERKAK